MKKLITLGLALLFPIVGLASGGTIHLENPNVDLNDKKSLQEGAKFFAKYCMGCHSLNYSRFERVSKDLEMPEEEVKKELMFTSDKIGETMSIAMTKEEGVAWFGVAPPDLSVTARSRGTDWLYTYLLTFYEDPNRPFGVNNLVFKDVAMPHVLWERQGWQKPVYETTTDAEGKQHQTLVGVKPVDEQKNEQYKKEMRNLVAFMEYVSEPAKLERHRLGPWVLGFLVIFLLFAYALKKEYWRDIH